jgi:hypothetical protein
MIVIKNIEEVIATRSILVKDKEKKITIIIGKPKQFPDTPDYYCPYQILGIGDEKIRYAAGIDAVQAIQLAMVMIGSDLYTLKEATTGQLRWKGDEKGDLGFPAP